MRLEYRLEEAGWATVTVYCGSSISMTASYLHDSLRELATAVLAICRGEHEARVIFMDEPGEHHLVLGHADAEQVQLQIFWHDDWTSWNMSKGEPKLVFSCDVRLEDLREQVLQELRRILKEEGLDGYKRKWVEHAFPTQELEALEAG